MDAALLHLVSAGSKFVPLSLSYALTKTTAYLSDRSSCDVILPINLVRQLMHAAVTIDGPASTDNAALDECAAYATAVRRCLAGSLRLR